MSAARRHVILGAAGIVLAAAFGAYVLSGLGGHPGGPFQVTVTFARVGQLLPNSGGAPVRAIAQYLFDVSVASCGPATEQSGAGRVLSGDPAAPMPIPVT